MTTILGALGINITVGTPFSVTVSFDKPPGLPAAATDVIDFHILLGDAGALGALRVVASVDINTSAAGIDLAQVNLAQKLWLTEINVVGFPLPGSQQHSSQTCSGSPSSRFPSYRSPSTTTRPRPS